MGILRAALRWLAGCEPRKLTDDLEPYCTESILLSRRPEVLTPGEARAIHKIGARYGAEI